MAERSLKRKRRYQNHQQSTDSTTHPNHISLPLLPNDIIFFRILPLLPLLNVVRLRCVSKTWYTSLTHHHFLKLHCLHHHQIIMISYPKSSSNSHYYKSITFDHTNSSTIIRTHTPPDPAAYMVGSCDGIILLHKIEYGRQRRFFLWNPTTSTSIELPRRRRLDLNYTTTSNHKVLLCGVGFDHIIKDYKILIKLEGPRSPQIYSRKTNSWKTICNDVPNVIDQQDDSNIFVKPIERVGVLKGVGVFVSGFLHWSMLYRYKGAKGRSQVVILSFDLVEEEFRFVTMPKKSCSAPVCCLDGLLCVGYMGWEYCDLWVMKEYGVVESWTKLMRISCSMGGLKIQPLCVTHDGVILHETCSNKIVLYDPKAKSGEVFKTLVELMVSMDCILFQGTNQVLN